MIRGLEHFKNNFKNFSDDFVLIGGVSSYLLLKEAEALKVRPTKDLDIVLFIRPSDDFLKTLRDYIRDGGYEIERGEKGKASFYRFKMPQNKEFPIMIELFSTASVDLELSPNQHIIPISTPDDVESLSAILLDNEYFELIKRNIIKRDEINLLNEKALIPLKAKAYLDIKRRGSDSKQWKKHRSDIINLTLNFITNETKESLPESVKMHFKEFLNQIKMELTTDIIKGASKMQVPVDEIINLLEQTYLS